MRLQSTITLACFHKHGCEDGTMRKDGMDQQHIVHVWLQIRSDCDMVGIQTCWRFFLHGRNLRESAILINMEINIIQVRSRNLHHKMCLCDLAILCSINLNHKEINFMAIVM
ncbi:hypothetical protein C0J52_06775 [Blattella germanica]|nr:hypothetical protein C0J52_06775 [Blattella germanica]